MDFVVMLNVLGDPRAAWRSVAEMLSIECETAKLPIFARPGTII